QESRGGETSEQGSVRGDEQVQRANRKSRNFARHGWFAIECERRKGQVFWRKENGHRRAVHRSQGTCAWLLDRPGEIAGRGGRVGEAGSGVARFGSGCRNRSATVF